MKSDMPIIESTPDPTASNEVSEAPYPTCGRYGMSTLLGEGGMGQVFEALDSNLQRTVAVKTLHAELTQEVDSRSRFVQEAKTTGRLEHPGIPPIHELNEDPGGTVYFVMKKVKGQTLATVISKLKEGVREFRLRYTFPYRAQVMKSICEAVHFANLNGVYHRDIKPENVMIGEHGEVQLMDWGASFDEKLVESRPSEPDFIGTPAYSAPERFSDSLSSRTSTSEVYSLGALMFEFFTLKPMYEAPDLRTLLLLITTKKAAAPLSVRSPNQTSCPVEYSYIIEKATTKEPELRYKDAGAFAQAIQLAIQDDAPWCAPVPA